MASHDRIPIPGIPGVDPLAFETGRITGKRYHLGGDQVSAGHLVPSLCPDSAPEDGTMWDGAGPNGSGASMRARSFLQCTTSPAVAARGADSGIEKKNELPWPGALSTQIRPP